MEGFLPYPFSFAIDNFWNYAITPYLVRYKMKIHWYTDIHLDHLRPQVRDLFLDYICSDISEGDVVVVTGDIANSNIVIGEMMKWEKSISQVGGKLFFVTGNHDYYGSSIENVTKDMEDLLPASFLPSVGVGQITDNVAIIGHNGWWDGLYADFFRSDLDMNDYHYIKEYNAESCPTRKDLFVQLNKFSQEAAEKVFAAGVEAAKNNRTIIVATHVPPFPENSVYNGQISDSTWLPHFSSKRMGDVLLKLAATHRENDFIVLCGHSHGSAIYHADTNLVCHTGEAQYGNPKCAGKFTF